MKKENVSNNNIDDDEHKKVVLSVGTNRCLLQRLPDFDPGNGERLADIPLDVLPMPCKPVFYDVAWTRASQFPDWNDIMSTTTTASTTTSKGRTAATTTMSTGNGSSSGTLLGWFRGSKS